MQKSNQEEKPIAEIVKSLYDCGDLKILVRAGYVSTKIFNHYEVYCKFKHYESIGITLAESVLRISLSTNINARTIYRIIQRMRAHE